MRHWIWTIWMGAALSAGLLCLGGTWSVHRAQAQTLDAAAGVGGAGDKKLDSAAVAESQVRVRAGEDAYDWEKWRQFWSFRPIVRPAAPAVKDEAWARNGIDRFLLSRLEEKGLAPAREADRAAWIRRAAFDLLGFPPHPSEVRNFENDQSPDAYEKVVDRLLASPHYGERWGRHWLDVARYVPGRISFPGVKHSTGDQAYRDYVVRALNKDKPYDQFVTEQIAGDLLPASTDREQEYDQITAPAFLSIGAWFDMCTDPNRLRLEMVDEMVSTTSKAFLGLSVGCARCHDHKFDPIPTADYYALGGIFRGTRLVGDFSEFWRDGRVRLLRPLAMPTEVAANDRIRQRIDAKKQQRWDLFSARFSSAMAGWRADEPRYRQAADELRSAAKPWVRLFEAENFSGQDNLRITELMRDGGAVQVVETQTPTAQYLKYQIEVPATGKYRLEALYSSDERTPINVTVNGPEQIKGALAEDTGGWPLQFQRWSVMGTLDLRYGLNFLRLTAREGNFPRLDRFRLYRVDDGLDERIAAAAAAKGLDAGLLRNFVVDPDRPWPTPAGMAAYLDDAARERAASLSAEMDQMEKSIALYPLVVSVTDQPDPGDLPVHIKGNTYNQSKQANPRGVPRLLEGCLPSPRIAPGKSGRLELAKWLIDRRNPLTARVMVNRIWAWHFGQGLVATPSDFGSRGDPPSHPELLDWLADTFTAPVEVGGCGWSLKRMHRLIMLSSAYRMSCLPDPASGTKAVEIDPENKLLSHFTRRRLEAEEVYDAFLSCINTLSRQPSGEPLDLEKSKGRALYVLTSNRSPKRLGLEVRKFFALFDVDASGVPIDKRPASATAAQSLFWLNNPLPEYFAGRFADRLIKAAALTEPKRIEFAYMVALGHPPSKAVAEASLAYVHQCQADGLNEKDAWAKFCLALLGSAEFRWVD